jgi:hypothetical protein
MMKKILLFGLLVMLLVSVGFACEPTEPTTVMHPGDSHCFQPCDGDFFTITFETGGRPGPENYPILVWGHGCAVNQTNCDVVCNPLTPPDTLVLGGNEFYPDCYYGLSADFCLDVLMCWDHDDQWHIEVFSMCPGCFCLTYERQLAVELLDFSAVAGDREVQIDWSTASEQDNQRFEIARDGQTVAMINAAGNSSSTQHYSWTDNAVENGVDYHYELVAVDMTGARTNLRSTSATPSFTAGVVSEYALHQNYPNPFNPDTQIAFDLVKDGLVNLKVYNLLGQPIATLAAGNMSAGRHVVSFSGSTIASGVYLYKLDVNGFSATKKLVLLK